MADDKTFAIELTAKEAIDVTYVLGARMKVVQGVKPKQYVKDKLESVGVEQIRRVILKIAVAMDVLCDPSEGEGGNNAKSNPHDQ